jgi:hypothetical protein
MCLLWARLVTCAADLRQGHPVYNKPLPGLGWNNNSIPSFWGSLFDRSASFTCGELASRAVNWKRSDTAVVHMFHTSLWGGWQYQLAAFNGSSQAFELSYGGYQEARGSHIRTNHFYVENVLEELDVPGEWYFDEDTGMLFVYFNGTSPEVAEVVLPLHSKLIQIAGNASGYAASISLSGLTFTETRTTFMEQYEVQGSVGSRCCWLSLFVDC